MLIENSLGVCCLKGSHSTRDAFWGRNQRSEVDLSKHFELAAEKLRVVKTRGWEHLLLMLSVSKTLNFPAA